MKILVSGVIIQVSNGSEITPALYNVVAEILSFVYKLDRLAKKKNGKKKSLERNVEKMNVYKIKLVGIMFVVFMSISSILNAYVHYDEVQERGVLSSLEECVRFKFIIQTGFFIQ